MPSCLHFANRIYPLCIRQRHVSPKWLVPMSMYLYTSPIACCHSRTSRFDLAMTVRLSSRAIIEYRIDKSVRGWLEER
jgi:hypothetical protein